MVTVIYKNEYNIKVNRKTRTLFSKNKMVENEINTILNNNDIKNMNALLYNDEENIDEYVSIQKKLSEKYKIDYPSLESIHYYSFGSKNAIKIAEELRKLPYVASAYPTPIGNVSSIPNPTFVSRKTLNDIHLNAPAPANDPRLINNTSYYTQNQYENENWGWFNHHKIFQAWDVYKANFPNSGDISSVVTSDKPVIAVLDDGFYKGSDADAPPYYTGAHYDTAGNLIDTNTSQHTYTNNPQSTISHGTAMANIIASPKNNGVGLFGVIPGAAIYPIKMDFGYNSNTNKYSFYSSSMAAGIKKASDQSFVDVISCSISLNHTNTVQKPISYSTDVSSAIDYAQAKGKPVVMSAGNTNTNLDPLTSFDPYYGYITTPNDSGVVVGGSSVYSGKEWIESNGIDGSCYGKIVDLSAQGNFVYAPTWSITTNSLAAWVGNNGTSPATAIVSGVLGMMKKLAWKKNQQLYTPYELRNVVAYTGTLGDTTSSKWLGRGLVSSNNVNSIAKMRDLNAWAALTVIDNNNNSRLVRIFNNDDNTWATTNADWNGRYTGNSSNNYQESYFEESFWKFPSGLPSGTTSYFTSNDAGGNGSFGYQEYIWGKVSIDPNTKINNRERINGVLSRYNTSTSQNIYYTLGDSTVSWFGGGGGWQ